MAAVVLQEIMNYAILYAYNSVSVEYGSLFIFNTNIPWYNEGIFTLCVCASKYNIIVWTYNNVRLKCIIVSLRLVNNH